MSLVSLRTFGFRNLEDAETVTDAKNVFLVGENGQGKTNFLEAVYFCVYASSFRSAKDQELVSNSRQSCSVIGTSSDGTKLTSIIDDGKKLVKLDDKTVVDRKQLLEVMQAVVFCHEDLEFVSGAPERRRWFFDQTISLTCPGYIDEFRRYRKILKTRNALLKERNTAMLEFLDPQFAESGLALMRFRQDAVSSFSPIFGPLYERVSGIDGVSVRYGPSWKHTDPEKIVESLAERREMDVNFGTSLSGPHRDRYGFIKNGSDFARYASTGQRRLLSLLLRSAQAYRFSEATGKLPLLLLDDVLLELDPQKRREFVLAMPAYEQAFFTFLNDAQLDAYHRDDALIYTMRGGVLSA